MKKGLFTMILLASCVAASQAQTPDDPIDLEAVIALPAENALIPASGSLDTNKIRCGIRCNTNALIPNTQTIAFYSSFNVFPSPTTVNASGISFVDDQSITAPAFIYVMPNADKLGPGHVSPFTLAADSIKALCDWTEWQNDVFKPINRADLVAGKAYGFFFKALGVRPEGGGVNDFRDDPMQGSGAKNGNNRAAVKIIWNPASSIGDMLAKKDKVGITVYPSPASSIIRFSFDFHKASHATAVVRDITGKIAISRNFGKAVTGKQEYSLDISGLSNGTYVLQFDTDEQMAVAKFAVKR